MSFEEVLDQVDGQPMGLKGDRATGAALVSLATALAGEDFVRSLIRTEAHYSQCWVGNANTVVRNGAGVVHCVQLVMPLAAGTGAYILDGLDNTGKTICQWYNSTAAAVWPPQMIIDYKFTTGLYIQFDAGAGTSMSVIYENA